MSDPMTEETPTTVPSADVLLTQLLQSLTSGQNNLQQLLANQQQIVAQITTPKTEKPKSRVAAPDSYDGSPEKLDIFLRQLYLTFSDDVEVFKDPMRKIRFALSYMKDKFALQWASRIIGELEDGSRRYKSWEEFRTDLVAAFSNANKKEQAQRKLELLRQGSRPAEEYFVEFEEYKALAKYNNEGYVAILK
jgi:Retrotransposon gag protein